MVKCWFDKDTISKITVSINHNISNVEVVIHKANISQMENQSQEQQQ